jgi:CheY-like chemotaxis protein
LNVEDARVRLSISDVGNGVRPGFIRHHLFKPFSQENPQSEGIGLGLSLVKSAATTLGGDVLVDSSETWGSTFTVTFSLSSVIHDPSRHIIETICNNLQPGTADLPQLVMSLFTPSRWETLDDVRSRRCVEMLRKSLLRGLGRWFQIKIIDWKTPSVSPRLRFVLLQDLEFATLATGDIQDDSKLVVLCPNVDEAVNPPMIHSKNATIIIGPVTVSTLQAALARLFPDTVLVSGSPDVSPGFANCQRNPMDVQELMTSLISTSDPGPLSDLKPDMLDRDQSYESTVRSSEHSGRPPPDTSQSSQINDPAGPAQSKTSMTSRTDTPPDKPRSEPKLLLVDDNSINLKVLSMFAHKASSTTPTSVGSGQEALHVFVERLFNDPYDIIFLDLSMPEMSGFEVAQRMREIEQQAHKDRTYVCALTALVSTKDRHRAFEAGVDEYLVKPAKFANLKGVVDRWRERTTSS